MKGVERLLEIALEKGALKFSDFVLASGKGTSYYFDGRLLTLDPEGAYLVGGIIMDILHQGGIQGIGGPTLGADPIVAAVALTSHIRGNPVPAFIVRKEAKGYGTERLIEGQLVQGSRVAIVDDVCTTGASLFHAIGAAEEAGCLVAKVIVLVDRVQGGSEELRQRGYDFTCLMEATPDGLVGVAPAFVS